MSRILCSLFLLVTVSMVRSDLFESISFGSRTSSAPEQVTGAESATAATSATAAREERAGKVVRAIATPATPATRATRATVIGRASHHQQRTTPWVPKWKCPEHQSHGLLTITGLLVSCTNVGVHVG